MNLQHIFKAISTEVLELNLHLHSQFSPKELIGFDASHPNNEILQLFDVFGSVHLSIVQ
jgi:hypothetical protein